ncbi:response regulator [bacterium]|nr:response regulator [bacterium]
MEKQKKILMVEDDPFFRKLCVRLLKDQGFLVVIADNGEEGLEKIKKEKPDLILLDVILPKMTGFEVLEAVRKIPDPEIANTPTMFLSNLYSEEELQKAKDLKAKAYLVKANTGSDELLEKIERILKGEEGFIT